MSDGFAHMAKQLWPDKPIEDARKRAMFFSDFGYMPEGDVDEQRKRVEEAQVEAARRAEERRKNPPPAPAYDPPSHSSGGGHSCNGHHCYHTYPGTYGGSRSDTYDPTLCCHCGASAPNPWENDRR